MENITTVNFDLATLKVRNADTGLDEALTLQGSMYTVPGVYMEDGVTLRPLSMGELVMVLCLARATEKENEVIKLMEEINVNTRNLESLTYIEERVMAEASFDSMGSVYYDGQYYTVKNLLNNVLGISTNLPYSDIVTEIEAKMDSLNSFSQQTMIRLQSETNKRDQSYDMITNILKSLNTVQIGIVNNI